MRWQVTACGLLWCLGAVAQAPPEPLEPLSSVVSLASIATEACAHSPRVRAAEQTVAAARAAARAAGARPGPQLELSPLYSTERQLDLDAALVQNLYDPSFRPTSRAAQAALAGALLDLDEVRLEVAAEARHAYLRGHAAERLVAAQVADLELVRALRDAAVQARDAGERPGVDVLRAELELSRAEQALTDARAIALAERATLLSMLGRDAGTSLTLEPALEPAPAIPDRAELLEHLEQRPRLRSAAVQVELRRRLVDLARSQRQPALELAGFREDQEQGVRLSFSLPLGGDRKAREEVRAAEAAVRQAEEELVGARREVTLEIDQAHLALSSASARQARFAEQVLQFAERLTDRARIGYRIGETSVLEVVDAQRLLAEARREAIGLDLAVAQAWVDLELALGSPFEPAAGADAQAQLPTAATAAAAPRGPTSLLGPPAPKTVLLPTLAPGGDR